MDKEEIELLRNAPIVTSYKGQQKYAMEEKRKTGFDILDMIIMHTQVLITSLLN